MRFKGLGGFYGTFRGSLGRFRVVELQEISRELKGVSRRIKILEYYRGYWEVSGAFEGILEASKGVSGSSMGS